MERDRRGTLGLQAAGVSAVLALAGWAAWHVLPAYDWPALPDALRTMPRAALLTALGLTVLNYVVLTGYDWLSLRIIGKRLASGRVGFAAAVSYAFSQCLGWPLVTGAPLRFRFCSRRRLPAGEIAAVVAHSTVTYLLGLFAMGGVILAFFPGVLAAGPPWPDGLTRGVGLALLALSTRP